MSLRIPPELQSGYEDWKTSVAWNWPGGATTWRLERADGEVHFAKVAPRGRQPGAQDEADRLRWAIPHLAVPRVVHVGSDETVEWLVTRAINGVDATVHHLFDKPDELVPILATALANFHRSLPVSTCPFDFSAPSALAHVRQRVEAGLVKHEDFHGEHAHLSPESAVDKLESIAPTTEDLVVCHGDYCLPNVLLDATGAVTGFVDLGALGVADRWWDLAVGSWSVTWNLGDDWEDLFLAAYGVERDDERIAFYRLLYDLAS
jgi:kanamycin kinase